MPTYPVPAGPRIPYDIDGSVGVIQDRNTLEVIRAITPAEMSFLASSKTGKIGTGTYRFYSIALSRPHDIVGYWSFAYANPPSFFYSTDTTNGVDGTWTAGNNSRHVNTASSGPSEPQLRADATVTPILGVTGVRVEDELGSIGPIMLFGSPSSGADTNRLALWDPTLDQALDHAALDAGDLERSAVHDITLRVKNLHTAAKTNVTLSVVTDGIDQTPTFASQHTIDYNGGGYGASPVNIGTLSAGQISDVFTVRQTIDPSAQLGIDWARIIVDAD